MAYPQTQNSAATGAQPVLTSVAAPTLTASTTAVMLGLGAAGAVITPIGSGKVRVDIDAVALSSVIGDGVSAQVAYGTGTAPANGAAPVGTVVGSVRAFVGSTAAGQQGVGFHVVVTGLQINTAYWFDLQFFAVTGGNATLKTVDCQLAEI